jgi:hypothetical protein
MEREPKTPVENAEDALRRAREEFDQNPTDANEEKMRNAENFVRSTKEFAAKHLDFDRRPPKP